MKTFDENALKALQEAEQWALDELEAARLRVSNLRYGGEAYNRAIEAVDSIVWLIERISNTRNGEPPKIVDVTYPPHPAEEEAAAVFEEPESEPVDDRPTPKLEDVRALCGEAKRAGVDIKSLLNDLGYKNLSSVDPTDYNTLVDRVNEAQRALS